MDRATINWSSCIATTDYIHHFVVLHSAARFDTTGFGPLQFRRAASSLRSVIHPRSIGPSRCPPFRSATCLCASWSTTPCLAICSRSDAPRSADLTCIPPLCSAARSDSAASPSAAAPLRSMNLCHPFQIRLTEVGRRSAALRPAVCSGAAPAAACLVFAPRADSIHHRDTEETVGRRAPQRVGSGEPSGNQAR